MPTLTTPGLKLFLLGPPHIEFAGRSVVIQRHKALALLSYLAMKRVPQQRDSLASLFWPESSQSSARTALSRHCSALKQALGANLLILETATVGVGQSAEIWLDVTHFQQTLAQCINTQSATQATPQVDALSLLATAVNLYRADFLDGFTLSGCPDFDDWQALQSESLRQALSGALAQLMQIHLMQGDHAAGLSHAQRWLSLDPWQELAHQQVMTLHVHQQTAALALQHYERYRERLADEFGVAPGAEITTIYEQIRRGTFERPSLAGQAGVTGVVLPVFLQEPDQKPPALQDAPFVARVQELAQLQTAMDEAKAGRGRPLFVIGGAGRGKTTLLTEFARRALAADPELLVISGHANAYTGIGDPYLPWSAALTLLLGDVEARVRGGQLPLDQARRLWLAMPLTLPLLAHHALDLVGAFVARQPLLTRAALVNDGSGDWLSRLEKTATVNSSRRLDQQQFFDQFTALLHAIAAQRPLLLILEDLHWADASSISLLFHCCRHLGGHPICLLGTYRHNSVAVSRDGQPHPLLGVMAELKRQYGDIWLDLAVVDAVQGRHFVDAYLNAQAGAHLAQSFRQALFAHTGGHPLFTVELVQDLQARGALQRTPNGDWVEAHAIDWEQLPAKVEGVIEQRLNDLAADLRQALMIASVEGETFTAEVVAHVQGSAALTLVQQLSSAVDRQHHLIDAQALEWTGAQRLSRYRFRHYLFQRYLYQQMDTNERAYLHEAVGLAMENLYGEQATGIAVPLAHHFQAAGRVGKAVHHLQIAAQAAVRKSAYTEGINHLRLAIDLLAQLPLTAARDQQELTLQLALGQAFIAVKGYGVPDVAQAFKRARGLCEQVSALPQRFPILYGLYTYYFTRAEHHTAHQLAEQMWTLAQSQPEIGYLILAHRALGISALQMGELTSARQHLAQVITLYDPERHHEWVLQSGGIDSGVMSQATIAFAHWYLGYPEQMLESTKASIVLAERLGHPFSLAAALGFAGFAHQFRGEVSQCRARAEEVIALCQSQKFPLWIPLATCLLGWAWVEEGETAAGIAQMETGLAALRATGTELLRPRCLALLVEAYGGVGQVEAAILAVTEALRLVETTGERSHEAELHRLHGELLRQECDEVKAEACYLRAIQVAQQQEAKSWELRAVMSLGRLWQKQGKEAAARQRLAAIYSWFSEGFETADLIEAKALLAALT